MLNVTDIPINLMKQKRAQTSIQTAEKTKTIAENDENPFNFMNRKDLSTDPISLEKCANFAIRVTLLLYSTMGTRGVYNCFYFVVHVVILSYIDIDACHLPCFHHL